MITNTAIENTAIKNMAITMEHRMRRRNEEVFRRALELAESGTCRSWLDVQNQLMALGYRRAPDLLDADKLRAIVDSRCRIAASDRKCA